MDIKFKIWLEEYGVPIIGEGKYKLLKKVVEVGSLNKAAQELDIPYKKAFNFIKLIEEQVNQPVLTRTQGKAAKISEYGIKLIKVYEYFHNEIDKFLKKKLREFDEKDIK